MKDDVRKGDMYRGILKYEIGKEQRVSYYFRWISIGYAFPDTKMNIMTFLREKYGSHPALLELSSETKLTFMLSLNLYFSSFKAFDSVKDELSSARSRNAIRQKNSHNRMNDGQKISAIKREATETTAFPYPTLQSTVYIN